MKFYVYVLFSLKDRKLYIGLTADLKRRFSEHVQGKVISTRNRRQLVLIYYEYFINQSDAKSREKFLKSGFGRNELKKCIKRTLEKLGYRYLSRKD